MKTSIKSLLLLLLLAGLTPVASSQTIFTPSAIGNEVDPVGDNQLDGIASGSETLANFNTLSPTVVQDRSGAAGTVNIGDLPDIDFRITSPLLDPTTIANFSSSSVVDPQNARWSGTDGQTLTIEFGTWDGSSFNADQEVGAAGLMLLNFGGAYNTGSGQTVTFYDSMDNVLDTQVFGGGPDINDPGANGSDWFSGYISPSRNIAKVTLDVTRNSGNSFVAFDDVAFAAVPEPSSMALLCLGTIGGWFALRRARAAESGR